MYTAVRKLHFPRPAFGWEAPAYLVASGLALALDFGLFSAGLHILGWHWFWAGTLGFVAGAVVAYLLSVHWVFATRRFEHAPDREFSIFVVIGLVGIGITQFVLWLGIGMFGALPEAVKLLAALVTFVFNYTTRKTILFSAPAEAVR